MHIRHQGKLCAVSKYWYFGICFGKFLIFSNLLSMSPVTMATGIHISVLTV